MTTGRGARLLAFAGSTRSGSFNKRLVAIAASGAEQAGADVTRIDLADFPLPLYDGDLESDHGIPEQALRLRKLMVAHHGMLIASPEYNSGYSAVLKNAIDWVSRPIPDQPPLVAFSGKVAGLMAASPGGLGGLRGLVSLRMLLGNINMLVVPDQIAVSGARDAFTRDGGLKNSDQDEKVRAIGAKVATVAATLAAG